MGKKTNTKKATEELKQPEDFQQSQVNPNDKSNQIEQDFNMESVKRLDEQFLELERDKLKQVGEFIRSQTHEKSQIKAQERKVLPIIQAIAREPFKISQGLKYDHQNPFWIPKTEDTDSDKYRISVLEDFLKFYFEDGISIDRAGRKEIVEILRGLTNNPAPEIEIKKENKLMR